MVLPLFRVTRASTIVLVVVVVRVLGSSELDGVQDCTDDGRFYVSERSQALVGKLPAGLERPHDEHRPVNEAGNDGPVRHGDEGRAVDDHAVEALRQVPQKHLESLRVQHVGWIGRQRTGAHDA